MTDPSMVDHVAQLKFKLLEKRLENEQKNIEKIESPLPTASNRHEDMLQSALKRRKNLLQELREQHLLEELSQPSVPARRHYTNYSAGCPHICQIPFPAPQAETPRIIQQAMPPQPATIIQQLPQPPPLIAQIPPAQPFAHPRSGSIKEDMVEMMLMQNAQMHQIIMQNMMLKSLPPTAFAQPARPSYPLLQHTQQGHQNPFAYLHQGPADLCSCGCESRSSLAVYSASPPPLLSPKAAPPCHACWVPDARWPMY
ncbi:uncharacterized protein C21orf58 homolog isoform X3 [Gallus gallus]|uniref:uncharacterized protein C21orf58 homolog isoform X3 n=1 Tax=Gallus gallus TaxID=9031 RepID=UPI0003506801|nr:uncharacterized protein C21orf58 homolog isoform X3 [Gallus gallus]XP_040531701.1 uncharacterized protein C21orf58 homolog isoform X3 [Gallus gallus]|eukprot:XP_025008245.1 uncharacterized protein C21orf58 homolog isoform X3 [Gallus gallus]